MQTEAIGEAGHLPFLVVAELFRPPHVQHLGDDIRRQDVLVRSILAQASGQSTPKHCDSIVPNDTEA